MAKPLFLGASLQREAYSFSELAREVCRCEPPTLSTRAWRARRAGHPHPLPVATPIPGGGEVYLAASVADWLRELTPAPAPRRGAPTKAERIARRFAEGAKTARQQGGGGV